MMNLPAQIFRSNYRRQTSLATEWFREMKFGRVYLLVGRNTITGAPLLRAGPGDLQPIHIGANCCSLNDP